MCIESYNLDWTKLDSLLTNDLAMIDEGVRHIHIDGEMFKSLPTYGNSTNSCFTNAAVKCVNKIRECGLHYQEFKE